MARASVTRNTTAAALWIVGDVSKLAKSGRPMAPATPSRQLTNESERTKGEIWPFSTLFCRNRCWYSWLNVHASPNSTPTALSPKKNTYALGGST